MTEAKHTPGPWGLKFSEVRPWSTEPRLQDIVDSEGRKLYCAGIGITSDREGEGLANARLIAAAPELIASLSPFANLITEYERVCEERDEQIGWHRFLDEFSWPTQQACTEARATIAKATGAA